MPHGPVGALLVIFTWIVVAAALALILTVIALWRRPIKARLLLASFVVLFAPYFLAMVLYPGRERGIAWAMEVTTDLWITPGTALIIAVAALIRRAV